MGCGEEEEEEGSEEMPENEGRFEGGTDLFPPLPFRE